MVISIAPEKDIKEEINILHQLFEAGLEYYHLRKPLKNHLEHVSYLSQIDSKYHNRIVVHFFHELINEFNLKGIHFQEQKRKDSIDNPTHYFKNLKMFGKTISASFHEPDDLKTCEFEFDYHLLSPIFSSISKQGYEGRGFNVNHIDKAIVGMGGVTSKNVSVFKSMGYTGVATLGSIWNSSNPVEAFIKIKEQFDQT